MPSATQAMSCRNEFWNSPEDLQNAADRMSGRATWQLYAYEAESARTSCTCHTIVLTISLSVGFLDSLHDPSAYVAPHDISEAAVPVYEHTLTASPPPPPPQLSNGT